MRLASGGKLVSAALGMAERLLASKNSLGPVSRSGRAELALAKMLVQRVVRRFFFSSRRRHTRFDCDWSSDVCSSDLSSVPKPRSPSLSSGRPGSSSRSGLPTSPFLRPPRSNTRSTLPGCETSHRSKRSEEHTSELQSQSNLVCRLLLEKKKYVPMTYV